MNARNLTLATAAFALTFWAWNLIGPLSSSYTKDLGLSPGQTSLLVATPVLVGSLGRIPAGVLTDKFGGRLMFAIICFLSIVPTLLVGWSDSYGALILWGFFLGIAGTSFAVGIPFVNGWYEPARRGFATGVFGAGMGGTALSALLTPRLVDHLGRAQTHILMAVALANMGVVMLAFARNAPGWRPATEPALPRIRDALRLKATWQGALLYAVAFAGTAVMAVVLGFEPPPEIPAGLSLIVMAFFLGLGTGGVFALIAELVDPAQVGTVTGLVGVAGGLGGYFPPLVMGLVYSSRGDYTVGYLLLALTAAAALLYTLKVGRELPAKGTSPVG
ncbi:MFS transporter [Nocardia yamanashiensis]|uniref:MFS transporter n=1 Tax=Nocardia yamanashiensis TaxID=209247 RepID=UPI00082E4C2D|nr:MFS transporter [Nocardia yamanashiensis]